MKIPGIGVLKGLKVVFWEMLQTYIRGPFTVQYPEERQVLPERFRGREVWLYDLDPETGARVPRCTACLACVRACPVGIISLESERGPDRKRVIKRFEVKLQECMFCGLCVEACNFHALKMGHDFELGTYDREALVLGMDDLLYPAEEYERTHPHDRKSAAAEKATGKEAAA